MAKVRSSGESWQAQGGTRILAYRRNAHSLKASMLAAEAPVSGVHSGHPPSRRCLTGVQVWTMMLVRRRRCCMLDVEVDAHRWRIVSSRGRGPEAAAGGADTDCRRALLNPTRPPCLSAIGVPDA